MCQQKKSKNSNQAQRSGDFMRQKWRIYGLSDKLFLSFAYYSLYYHLRPGTAKNNSHFSRMKQILLLQVMQLMQVLQMLQIFLRKSHFPLQISYTFWSLTSCQKS